MLYCPNPECAYVLRHHEPAEYRDSAQVCSDCGGALVAERPGLDDTTRAAHASGPIWGRLALTAFVPALAAWLYPRVPLPGVDHALLTESYPEVAAIGPLSVFTLALGPVLSAFLVVEFAALCVPRWRALRHGGPGARERMLAQTWKLALGFATLQAWVIAGYLERWGLLKGSVRSGRLLVVLSLLAGTCVLVLLARWMDHAALGSGFSLLTLFGFMRPLAFGDPGAAYAAVVSVPGKLVPVVALAIVVCGGTVLLLRRRRADLEGRPAPVRLPACGIVPVPDSVAILTLAATGATLGLWPRASESALFRDAAGNLPIHVLLTLVLAGFWSFMFNRPARVAAFDTRAALLDEAATRRRNGSDLGWAVAWSAGYVLVLGIAHWFVVARLDLWPALNVVGLALATAVLLDVIAEARARLRHGDLIPVWPEHRPYALDAALLELERAGIPAFPRSANHRTLWHYFAPYIPIQILVPPDRKQEAVELLRARLAPGSPAPSRPSAT